MLYGLLILSVLLLVWASGEHVSQKLGLLLLTSWAISNVCVAEFGYDGAPYVDPTAEAFLAVLAAGLGIRNRSRVALAVVMLFVAELAYVCVAFSTSTQGKHDYYLTLNLILLCQLGVLGAARAKKSIGRIVVGAERLRHSWSGT